MVAAAPSRSTRLDSLDLLRGDLWLVYVVWAATIAVLYPLCRWYEGVKARSRSPWLRYS